MTRPDVPPGQAKPDNPNKPMTPEPPGQGSRPDVPPGQDPNKPDDDAPHPEHPIVTPDGE